MEKITLYFKQGSSDKVYQTGIEAKDGGYVVNFAYGRRGTTLQTGTKTQAAVDYDAAKGIYDKLIKEKQAKGYTVGEEGTPYSNTENANSGVRCQLLNPIEENEVHEFINNPAFCAQEKYDGRRMLIRKIGTNIEGINRKGILIGVPETICKSAQAFERNFIIDGEAVGDVLYVFDVLSINNQDVRDLPYIDRHIRLLNLLASAQQRFIQLAETAFKTADKAELLDRLQTQKREGVVFKRLVAPYVADRPNTGGDQLKHKFYETASFIVGKINGKRSVSLKLLNGKSFVSAGNVTIPTNHEVPSPGTVIEVRYLYAFKESGCVFQPVYLGKRDDIDPGNCLVKQLKYKAEQELAAA